MPYITTIDVLNHYKLPNLSIDLRREGAPFQHLILTGPNGSGKTTILNALVQEVRGHLTFRPRTIGQVKKWFSLVDPDSDSTNLRSLMIRFNAKDISRSVLEKGDFLVIPGWSSHNKTGVMLLGFLEATRSFPVVPLKGPQSSFVAENPISTKRQGPRLLEYLVHLNIQARLADFDDKGSAEGIFGWLHNLETQLADLLDISGLRMVFDRQKYNVFFEEPSGVRYNLWELAAGHSAILDLLGELILRVDANDLARNDEQMSGVVIIDELEVHLHPELQEKILPFLTKTFPRLQFIVATHSPAVISSVDNAVVYDLERMEGVSSAELRGTPYGQLMTSYFGLETDIDLASTEQLRRLAVLRDKGTRTPEEEAELRSLAETLAEKSSQALALEIYNRMLSERLRGEDVR